MKPMFCLRNSAAAVLLKPAVFRPLMMTWPLEGVQYHPESFLTEEGEKLLANFLRKG